MSALAAFRSGRDAPSRIATSVVMAVEADALLPEEPMYQPVIPFYPAIVSGDGTSIGSGTTTTPDVWTSYPGRVDLSFYQGDDVTIPLVIDDPADSTPDFSTVWEWTAQIRVLHSYESTLVNTFSVTDEYTPPAGENPGYTRVTMFLPRSENVYVGRFRWDLYSVSPLDVAGFPRPPDVPEPEPWPPTDQIRTWLYGEVTIIPRVTETDILPAGGLVVDPVTTWLGPVAAPYGNFVVGPNGRVP